jgi:hypothetical protein
MGSRRGGVRKVFTGGETIDGAHRDMRLGDGRGFLHW